MNRASVKAEEVPLPSWTEALETFSFKVLSALGKDRWILSFLFCSNSFIKSLNARYRKRDEATDILSFPLGETLDEDGQEFYLPGDIVISLEALEENSRFFGVSGDEELRRLVIHGILHLDGMDHQSNDSGEAMLRLQEDLLLKLKEEHIITVCEEVS
ncbi:MAG: rRNA maturation RNase YbeY [Treponema sp.]|jgi:probable rRNA maturation factor|nr:rRNA maturation RNase YbeY [Treponema sp.]